MSNRIHLTVAAVIESDGKFLVVRECDNGIEVINQPAGHVEPGETLQQAVLRETLEETGWEVELTGLLGLTYYQSPANGKTYYRVSFTARPLYRAEDAVIDNDIKGVEWLTREELEGNLRLRSPMVLSDVIKYLNNEIYSLDFIDII